MYNPLLPDFSKVSNDALEAKITELMKKYLIASQHGQGQICSQISVILESLKEEQMKRYQAANKKIFNQNKNLDDYINVDN